MDARSFFSGLCSNPVNNLVPNPDKPLFPSYFCSSPSKRVSFKTIYFPLASKLKSPRNKLQCKCWLKKVEVKKKNLAVFVSGEGSNFKSIHEAILRGSVNGEIVVLVTNKPGCGGATYARDNNIPVILFPRMKDQPDGLSVNDLVTALRSYKVDFILLAGYLKLIPVELVRAYPRSILNIHPSLLPAFGGKGYYGMKVHQAVIASGARCSGPTIHFVDEHYDTGRILAQRVIPVFITDTAEKLAARVIEQEHQLYVEAAEALCDDRIVWRKDGVPLIRSKENPKLYK